MLKTLLHNVKQFFFDIVLLDQEYDDPYVNVEATYYNKMLDLRDVALKMVDNKYIVEGFKPDGETTVIIESCKYCGVDKGTECDPSCLLKDLEAAAQAVRE